MPLEHRFSACACYLVAAGNHHTGLHSQPQWPKTAIFPHGPKSGGAAKYMNNARATVLEAVLRLGLWKLRYYLCKLQVTATETGNKECRPPFTKGRIMR